MANKLIATWRTLKEKPEPGQNCRVLCSLDDSFVEYSTWWNNGYFNGLVDVVYWRPE